MENSNPDTKKKRRPETFRFIRRRVLKPLATVESLAAHLSKSEDNAARSDFIALFEDPFHLEKNLDSLVELFQASGKVSLLMDWVLSPEVGTFTSLSSACRVGQLARKIDRFGDFRRRILSVVESGGVAHFRQFEYLGKMGLGQDGELRALLLRLKLNGIGNVNQADQLFSNAALLAPRIKLNPRMLDHLYEHSCAKSKSRKNWVEAVKGAFAVQHLILEGRISKPAQLSLIDEPTKQAVLAQLNPSKGALILLCHAGFSTVRFSFFSTQIDNIVYMANSPAERRVGLPDRIPINIDARAGLFAGLKALMQKKPLLLAPDGKQGTQKSTLSVLGKPASIGEGAAFLAYESKCDTYWFSMNRGDDRFVPTLVPGPSRQASDSFAEFQERFVRFYEKMLNELFSGDPRNLVLTPRWAQQFANGKQSSSVPGEDEMEDVT